MGVEELSGQPPPSGAEGASMPTVGGARVGERGRFRRRRRPNAVLEERTVVQKVKLTAGEQQRLRQRAAEAGVTVPRLLVESAFSDAAGAGELRSIGLRLLSVHTDLSRAAGNMNQVAKKANTVHEVPSEFRPVMGELRRVAEEVERVTGAIAVALAGVEDGAAGADHQAGLRRDSGAAASRTSDGAQTAGDGVGEGWSK